MKLRPPHSTLLQPEKHALIGRQVLTSMSHARAFCKSSKGYDERAEHIAYNALTTFGREVIANSPEILLRLAAIPFHVIDP